MVHFVIGRTKTGKSTYCLEQFAQAIDGCVNRQPCYFIVPEQYALVTERKLLHLDGMKDRALLRDEVISFKRLSHRVLSQLGGLRHTRLEDSGKVMLLTQLAYNCRDQLRYYKELHVQSWQLNRILGLFDEFEKYAVGPDTLLSLTTKDDLQGTLRDKLYDLQVLYSAYTDAFNQIGSTEGTLFHLALQKAKEHAYFLHSSVWIDSFTGFTKLEKSFILLLMQQCKDVTITLTLDDDPIFDSIQTTLQSLIRLARENCIQYDTITLQEGNVHYYQNPELQFLENAYTKLHSEPLDLISNNVHIIENKNVFDEITNVAQSILQRRENGVPYGQIAVSTRHPEAYSMLIEAVFSHYHIPYFIDARQNIQSNPLIISILAILRFYSRNFRQEDVLTFMKAGLYFDHPGEGDDVENEILANKIQGMKRFGKSEHGEIVRFYTFFLNLFEQLKEAKNVGRFVDVLLNGIEQLSFPNKMQQISDSFRNQGLLERSDLYNRLWSQVESFCDQLKVFMGDLPVQTVSEGCETVHRLLSVCFSTYQTGFLPQNPDAVQITSIDRSRVTDVNTLYLIGVVEGAFPASLNDEGILNDLERSWLNEHAVELADDSLTKTSKERFLIYTTLFAPSEQLYVSYALKDFAGGDCVPASAVVGQMKRLCPNITVTKGVPDRETEIRIPTEVFIEAVQAKALFLPEKIPLSSVSKLERYRLCPYNYFLSYGLCLQEREEGQLELSDIGNIMHKLIEEGSAVLTTGDKTSREIVEDIFPNALISAQIIPEAVESGRGHVLMERLKKFAISTLDGIKDQLDAGDFSPVGFEVAFGDGQPDSFPPLMVKIGADDLPAIRLQGKIDRFDACVDSPNAYIRIIDYKSSAKPLIFEDIYAGKRLQLIAYMKALLQQETSRKKLAEMLNVPADQTFLPAGVLYFLIKDDLEKIDSSGTYKKNTYCMDGLVLNDENVLNHMIGNESAEVISFSRKTDGNFRKKNNWISFADYTQLSEGVDHAVRTTVYEIISGKIAPCPQHPYQSSMPCTYCAYNSVCGAVLKE